MTTMRRKFGRGREKATKGTQLIKEKIILFLFNNYKN